MSGFWPGDAFLASVLLLTPRRIWPALVSAGLAGFALQSVQGGLPWWTIAVGQAGAAIAVLIAALGLRYSFHGIPSLDSLKALGKFCFFAVLLAPSVSAFVGAVAAPASYWIECRTWFLGDVLAFLTVMPALLSWVRPDSVGTRRPWFRLEAVALIAGLIFLGYVIFFVHWTTIPPALLYSLVPFLVWSALRFGSGGVGTAMMVIAFSSIWGGVHGHSPFPNPSPLRNVLSIQLFLLFAAAPFMLLAAVVEERQHARLVEKELSGRLISAQEQERCRIARELHDDICQRRALLSIEIQRANRAESEITTGGAKQRLDEIRIHCSEIAGDVQALSHELHSANLDYLGIAAAIRSFCTEFSKQHEVNIKFAEQNVPKFLPRDSSLCLFRISQEALHNAVKYSGSTQFWVELTGTWKEVQLEVRDAGTGFDIEEAGGNGGLGLVSMRERVRMIDGRISIKSRPGAGTKLIVSVPIIAQSGGPLADQRRDQVA
jgi:signal transduction histidine kinase